MKKRLVVIVLVLMLFSLFTVYSFISDSVKIPVDTYNLRKFFVACDTRFENIHAYYNWELKDTIRNPYVINFKDKNVVFECARVGRGVSKNNMAYYVILYKNGTLKYIKGEALVEANPVGDKVFNKREKYYEGSEVDYIDISFF